MVRNIGSSMRTLFAAAVVTTSLAAQLDGQAKSVTLDDALELALQIQPAMVQARGQMTNARMSRLQAYGNWMPTINATSSVSTNSSQRFDAATQRTVSGSSTSYSSGFSASMTVFDGFSRLAQNHAASADYASADAALVNQSFQIVLQTKQVYYSALAADELVRVANTRIKRSDEQLKISKEKLVAGTATRSDTLRSRVELANAQLQLVNAQTQQATAQADLARLIGVDGSVGVVDEDRFRNFVEVDTSTLRQEALARSPVIGAATAASRAADAQVAVSRAQFFPTVSASYQRSWAGNQLSSLRPSWSARLNLSWPIFNGFSRELTQTRNAVARDAARAQADDAVRNVNAQLTQYLTTLTAARTRLEIARANEAASSEDLRVQRERYRLGAATIVEVLDSQINLDQAEVDIVQARLDYLVAKAQIEALIGREL
ncbi:MAG: TolC family protein [Gemmatimonadales bacterium]